MLEGESNFATKYKTLARLASASRQTDEGIGGGGGGLQSEIQFAGYLFVGLQAQSLVFSDSCHLDISGDSETLKAASETFGAR